MAVNNNASGGSKQNNISVHTSLFNREHYYVNSVPDSLRASVAVALDNPSFDDDADLWTRAYGAVQKREAKLMKSYMKHLNALHTAGDATTDGDLLDPVYVGSVVNQLMKIREKKKIQVMLPRADNEIQEEIEKLAKSLIWSDEIVKATLKTQPHVALAWSGVSIFLLLLSDTSVYNKEMLKDFNKLIDMQVFWKACEETHPTSSNSKPNYHLRDPMAKLYSSIIEYQARAICHIAKPISRTLEFVIGSDNWTEMMQPIQNLEQNCLRHITERQKAEIFNNSKGQLETIQKHAILQEEMLQELKNDKQDDMEQKLFGNLAEVSGDYAGNKNINPKRVPGTCEWFLRDDRFCNWRDRQAGALLWVSAGPGCGKSVLSRCLIDEGHLRPNSTITIQPPVIKASKRPSVICYFFFKDGNVGQIDGTQALCAILHQLFEDPLTSNLIAYALPSHRTHQETLTQKMDVLWQILVDCAKSSSADIICVLDALDECRGDSAQRLLGMIEDSSPQQDELFGSSKLKFLITSRPYDDLKWSFDRLLSVATYLHFDGDEKSGQIGEEINLVIDSKVQQFAAPFSDEDRDMISKRLKSMENRTYLWLHLTLNIIETNRSEYSRSSEIKNLLCELPPNVAGAYEKILSRSRHQGKVEALLQIVLAATRPLTLDEANNALALAVEEGGFSEYAALQGKLWPQSTFKTTVQNLCGLFISIHNSKLSFIHQTAREFLVSHEQPEPEKWKGRLSLSKSHGVLSRACINYLQLLDPSSKSPKDEYPFCHYAAGNWFLHFHSQDAASTEKLRKPARELCRTSAPLTRLWIEARMADFGRFSSSDLQFAADWGLAAVVYDIIVHEHANVNDEEGGRTLLSSAIMWGRLEVVEVLLDLGAEIREIDIEFAVRPVFEPEAMTTLLLDKRGSEIEITERVLIRAARNTKSGAAVLALLLKRRGDGIKITEIVVKAAAQWGAVETMTLLLDERSHEFIITEDVLIAAVYNSKDILALLLKRRGDGIKITEIVVKAAARRGAVETMTLLLDERGHEFIITEDVLIAAACNSKDILALLLKRRGHEVKITEQVVRPVAKRGRVEAMTLLLDKRGNEFTITEDILIAAAYKSEDMLALLLERRGYEVKITEQVVRLIIKKGLIKAMSLLLDKYSNKFIITEDILIAAVYESKDMLALLLKRCGDKVKITEQVARLVAEKGSIEIMSLLLDERGNEFTITEDILIAAAYESKDMLALLLERRGHEAKITEQVVIEVMSTAYLEALDLFLDYCNGIKITEKADKVIGAWVFQLLLGGRGHEITVTEGIIKTAIADKDHAEEVVCLLLDRRGHEINITEDIVKAAVKSKRNARRITSLLLDRRGPEINITEDIVKAAVANEGPAEEVMCLLLDRRGHEINITEDVIKTALANRWNAFEIMSLLLDRRGHEITVTKDVITLVQGIWWRDKDERDEMLALLKQRQDMVTRWSGRISHYKGRLKGALWSFWRRPGK